TGGPGGESAGGGPPRGGGGGGGPGEAAVQVGEERGEEGVGGFEGGDAAQPQFADEAVLQGLPEPFDAALGLRGACGDEPDTELAQDAAEVRGILGAVQLLLESPVGIVADKDVEAIAIQGQGQAVGGDKLLQQGDVAVQILGGPEDQGQDGARGIVDGPVQGELGTARLEPREGASVELHEGAIWASGVRRVRTWWPRRCRLAGRPRRRRSRRTEARLSRSPSTSCSFSVAWQSLKPA